MGCQSGIINKMHESFEQTPQSTETLQDVKDALIIAFWDLDFESCDSDRLPLELMGKEVRSDCLYRSKGSYDPTYASAVTIKNFRYESFNGSALHSEEKLIIEWLDDDDTNLLIDMRTLDIGAFVENVSGDWRYVDIGPDGRAMARLLAKNALAAVTTL
jgi:hypothetical protein